LLYLMTGSGCLVVLQRSCQIYSTQNECIRHVKFDCKIDVANNRI
jgi:hypothetical protein